MKIQFKKVSSKAREVKFVFNIEDCEFLQEGENITLEGHIQRVDSKLVKFYGKITGNLCLICVRSGEDFSKIIDEDLILYFSDGFWEMQSQKHDYDLDVIEFFDGFIDFFYIASSEVESIRTDYNIKE